LKLKPKSAAPVATSAAAAKASAVKSPAKPLAGAQRDKTAQPLPTPYLRKKRATEPLKPSAVNSASADSAADFDSAFNPATSAPSANPTPLVSLTVRVPWPVKEAVLALARQKKVSVSVYVQSALAMLQLSQSSVSSAAGATERVGHSLVSRAVARVRDMFLGWRF